jgi:hypothetical protein
VAVHWRFGVQGNSKSESLRIEEEPAELCGAPTFLYSPVVTSLHESDVGTGPIWFGFPVHPMV